MAIKYTQEDVDRIQKRYGAVFEQLRHYNSQQIGDILVKAHNSGLLAICGALFDDKDVDECYVALMIGIKMLKANNLTLPKEYLNDKIYHERRIKMTAEELFDDVQKNGTEILGRKLTDNEVQENAQTLVDYYYTLLTEDCDDDEEAAMALFNEDFYDRLKEQLSNC